MTEAGQPISFVDRNTEGYRCLVYVEVSLRELARYALRQHYGEKWQRRIPGRYLQKIRNDQKDDATQASLGFRALGPLYYLTFGELVELSSQKPVVALVKDVLGEQGPQLLQASVPARNAIAHSRDLTENALATIRALKMRMVTGLAEKGLARLPREPDIGLYPEKARKRLADWFKRVRSSLSALQSLPREQEDYDEASRQYWWSSSDLAGFDVARVERLAAKIRDYARLPGGVGAVATRQRYISESGILSDLEAAVAIIGEME